MKNLNTRMLCKGRQAPCTLSNINQKQHNNASCIHNFPIQLSRFHPCLNRLLCILASTAAFYTTQAQAQTQTQQHTLAQPTIPAGQTLSDNNMLLYLELVVNGLPSGHIAAVDYQNGRFHVRLEDLSATPVLPSYWEGAPFNLNQKLALDQIQGVTTTYDQALQRLLITVPLGWLPEQHFDSNNDRKRYLPMSSTGALLNYDLYVNKMHRGDSYASVWNEARLFGNYGTLSSTGVYRQALEGNNNQGNRYTRYDTHWELSDEERMLTLTVGDLITRPLTWSNPIRLGGVQLSRNFSTRPDIITYPLPQFSGEVAIPSAMELFVDGYLQQDSHLSPGPFTITNAPFINGAGQAVIVTTDALGRQVSTTVPFYITPDLLQQYMSDYTISLGRIRQRYGQRNFNYSTLALDGSYRYGINDQLTAEFHTEASSKLQLGGIGTTSRLGLLGVLNASYTYSHYDSSNNRNGHQTSAGYQYTARHFSFGARHTWRNQDYRDLTSLNDGYHLSLQSTQITAGVPLGNLGTFNAGYFSIKNNENSHTHLTNLSWNRSFGRYGTLHISANRSNGNNRWAGLIQWSISLGSDKGNLSVASQRNAQKDWTHQVDYSRAIPNEGGWGWNLGYQYMPSHDHYRQASLAWRNNAVELQGGAFGTSSNKTYWGQARGSVVWMDNNLFAANMVQDAFVVISTDGTPDIPVRYENSTIGHTNSKGHLLVPWTPAYYAAKYEIDPLKLPVNIRAPLVEQRIAVKSGSGYLLRFPVQQIIAANITLVDQHNQHLPVGSLVSLASGQKAYVGWDGLTYFENLEPTNTLTVQLPDDTLCRTQFALDMSLVNEQVQHIGPLTCTPTNAAAQATPEIQP